ncbi:TetR family transcriptional regulator [Devosia sp. Root685]|uniref:TetR/AcrR family transcriptional regulator n=1 Tax=Devosia sp. Root685 TaxID=1736587 RepID=UPI0006F83343|nr:TetR/AcrR family transcriptional regulator [Devosia sp. Root685]KRA96621.1 TetR family transcriptional regulator [Devosia sp. Root685]
MQEGRKTQEERREGTRRALIAAARRQFAGNGYAATNTPAIAAAAGVTRGALYHHFADKQALFEAVVEEEHALLALAINAAAGGEDEPGPVRALIEGGDAYLAAMQDIGRRRILLIDAPAVIGRQRLEAINSRFGLRTLVEGVAAAVEAGAIRDLPVMPLAQLLDALFDRAALAPAEELADYRKAIRALIRGLKT